MDAPDPNTFFENVDNGMCNRCPGQLLLRGFETTKFQDPAKVDKVIEVPGYTYRCIQCGNIVFSTEYIEKALTN